MKKFARWAEDTNRGINEGFVFGDGERYFETKKGLLKFLRELNWEDSNGRKSSEIKSDDELLTFFYNEDMYYHTEWELEDDNYFLEDGTEVEL